MMGESLYIWGKDCDLIPDFRKQGKLKIEFQQSFERNLHTTSRQVCHIPHNWEEITNPMPPKGFDTLYKPD